MAPRMRLGVAATVAAALAVTLWLVPPDPPEVRGLRGGDTLAGRATRLRGDLLDLEEALARVAIRDTVEEMVRRSAEGVVVDLPSEVPDSVASAYRSLIGARTDSLGMSGGGVTLVRAILPAEYGRQEDREWSARGAPGWLVLDGSAAGEPYCAVVRRSGRPGRDAAAPVRSGRDAVDDRDREPFHICRFHARYGLPGPRVRRWLVEQGGLALATTGPGELEPEGLFEFVIPFASNVVAASRDPWEGRCLAGDREACARTVLRLEPFSRGSPPPSTALPRASGFSPFFLRWRGSVLFYGGYGYAYLAELERAFGEERFRRFWSSERPVDEAFAEAFAEELGDYTHRWATARLGPLRAGPGPSVGSAALAVLLLALLAGASVWVGIRRTVT